MNSAGQAGGSGSALSGFHPAIQRWFAARFSEGASDPQMLGWPPIRAGEDVLIAAPTGSGKTLAGFLVAIDRLISAPPDERHSTKVVYVSPLKALAVDVHQNLESPLNEITECAMQLGLDIPTVTIGVRTGDTSASLRASMVKSPPDILVTTPESLYLMVTAEKSRETLRDVRTLIVDEIHALARDKRGTHLALTVERLSHIQHERFQRIGLSATQKPIDRIAELLVGSAGNARIVDCGHQRRIDLSISLPSSELGAVASGEQFGEVLDLIAREVLSRRTTLVFVNTRRLAERVAHQLSERLGDDAVSAHHGSLSKERRLAVESRLRSGDLRALVATASLELGIDVGPVELVCQLGSPRSIATFLQRVGRSNHSKHGIPTGILYPLTRDELVESIALIGAVKKGVLDAVVMPRLPLDILAQQIVAEVSAQEWDEDGLFDLVRGSAPFRDLDRPVFDEVLSLVSEGIETGRGTRAAFVHRDRVNARLRPRRGARLAALTSGGAIPEVGDYRVILDPDETFIGTLNEDFAIESMAGDVFLLGTHSWRIRRVEQGVVRVVDAGGASPTIPFWIGEAPSRTAELSTEVSELRRVVSNAWERDGTLGAEFARLLAESFGVTEEVAAQATSYLSAAVKGLGALPTLEEIVFERFFDESGGMQLVVHSPYGGRVNRALGLALRKRFCASFDFELQAAASDDAVVISLGPHHSFPLADAAKLVRSHSAPEVLTQAVLASPMFAVRWRWNLNRSLAVLRFRGGSKNPLPIQRMESDDLMAAVFPALAACQENAPAGPIPIPDHLLVRQTLDDCLHEAMDVDGLVELLAGFESGSVRTRFVDSTEPSVLSHEILNGRPFTFLDNAPLEERRTRAVQVRRGLPLDGRDLAALDADAIDQVRSEVAPDLRDPDELHDLLMSLVMTVPVPDWEMMFEALLEAGRAVRLAVTVTPIEQDGSERADAGDRTRNLWSCTEREGVARVAIEAGGSSVDARVDSETGGSASEADECPGETIDPDSACAQIVRGHLDIIGPCTGTELATLTGLSPGRVRTGLGRLEAEGFALQGRYDPRIDEVQWCSRRLLARIHSYTVNRRRKEIEPVSAQDFMRFLLGWHHLAPGTRLQGRRGVMAAIGQLQGVEVAAGSWEPSVLGSRIENYEPGWLDELCMSGEIVWGRLSVRQDDPEGEPKRGSATPSRATPITFAYREDLPWLLAGVRCGAEAPEPAHGASRKVMDALSSQGALFQSQLIQETSKLPIEVEEGLWDLVSRGLVTSDGFQAVRSLLSSRDQWRRRTSRIRASRSPLARRRAADWGSGGEGRWSQLRSGGDGKDATELADALAEQMLIRWGVVIWDLMAKESFSVRWRDVLWALRRMEARGLARGGRFVSGFSGEQYALPEAVDQLRQVRRRDRTGEMVQVNATDPMNLVGIVVPGHRVPSIRTNWITYVDGLPAGSGESGWTQRTMSAISPLSTS